VVETGGGYRIVLTADRTLMSEYGGGIFLGFSATLPRGVLPDRLYFSLLCPSVEVNPDGSVRYAPCGTRKVEAALLGHGFRREDVVVAHPDHLEKVVGPRTRVLGVTETDPLGIAPATSTFTQLFGGEAYMAVKFREVLNHPAVRRFRPRIVVGGPGAWELEDEEPRRSLGIDSVVVGEGERVVGPLFEQAVRGEELPEVVHGKVVPTDEIPVIAGPTINGIIEVARGCGRGCDFCVPTLQQYRCLPLDHVLREVDINLGAGRRPLLHAEDVLRYGARGLEVNREVVLRLFRTVRNHPGVNSISISHFALSSVASAPEVVEELSRILGVGRDIYWISGQTGIETGSPRLMRGHMAGKCRPFGAEEWPEVVVRAFGVLSRNRWVPCATLVIGLPGETDEDVDLTIRLVEELRGFRSLIVPLFLVPEGGLKGRAESFTLDDMTPRRSELFLKCWDHNLNWVPSLFDEWVRMSVKSRSTRYGLWFLISYGIKQGKKLISKCRDEYQWDLPTLVSNIRDRKIRPAPLPARLLTPVLRLRER